jgi:hypothetical protein
VDIPPYIEALQDFFDQGTHLGIVVQDNDIEIIRHVWPPLLQISDNQPPYEWPGWMGRYGDKISEMIP